MDREYDKMLDLLIRSLDSELSTDEAAYLTNALEVSEQLQMEKTRLLAMRARLKSWTAPADPGFSDRVLAKLIKLDDDNFSGVIISLFPRVAAACFLVLGVALGVIYMTEGSLMMETIIGVNEVALEDAVILVENGF